MAQAKGRQIIQIGVNFLDILDHKQCFEQVNVKGVKLGVYLCLGNHLAHGTIQEAFDRQIKRMKRHQNVGGLIGNNSCCHLKRIQKRSFSRCQMFPGCTHLADLGKHLLQQAKLVGNKWVGGNELRLTPVSRHLGTVLGKGKLVFEERRFFTVQRFERGLRCFCLCQQSQSNHLIRIGRRQTQRTIEPPDNLRKIVPFDAILPNFIHCLLRSDDHPGTPTAMNS